MSTAYALSTLPPPIPDRPAPRPSPRLRVLPLPEADGAASRRQRAAELYRTHGPAVYRRCRRILRNPDAAADATQEVFLRLVRHLDALAAREDLVPWLQRVATNHCLNLLRDGRGRAEEPLDPRLEPAGAHLPPDPDHRLLRRVLERFDEATQAIAVALLVEGFGTEELAEQLGVSRRTVSRKLDRFLELARRHLVDGLPPVAR